jgi:hypothetical protein
MSTKEECGARDAIKKLICYNFLFVPPVIILKFVAKTKLNLFKEEEEEKAKFLVIPNFHFFRFVNVEEMRRRE